MAQLVKIASVCRLCGFSVAYSYHIELFGKKREPGKTSNKRSVGYTLIYILNDNNGSANFRCAKCKRRVESLEMALMDLTKFKRSVAVL